MLRVIERGFIRGTLTIENVPRITRGGTKGAIDQRKERNGREGRQIEEAREDDGCIILYSRAFVAEVRFALGCAYRRWWYNRCINGCPLIDINDRCTSLLSDVKRYARMLFQKFKI